MRFMKFKVTPELATLLKTVRGQNGISSKSLAEHIDKSPSYISKLEAGSVRRIQKEDLTEILEYISEGDDFYEEKLPNLVRTLYSFMDPAELMQQSWLLQYDIVDRPIEVGADLARDLGLRIQNCGETPEQLTTLINMNVDSSASRKIPVNEVRSVEMEQDHFFFIQAFVDENTVETLSRCEPVKTTYNAIYSIVFYLNRLKDYGPAQKKMPPDMARKVLAETTEFLEFHNIHSLTGYGHALTTSEFQNSQLHILGAVTLKDSDALMKIVSNLQKAAEVNPDGTNLAVNHLAESLDWDPAFMLKLMGFSFNRLDGMSYTYKKELLERILSLLNEYASMPEEQKKMETY